MDNGDPFAGHSADIDGSDAREVDDGTDTRYTRSTPYHPGLYPQTCTYTLCLGLKWRRNIGMIYIG